jgi:hypothetical protein
MLNRSCECMLANGMLDPIALQNRYFRLAAALAERDTRGYGRLYDVP